MLSRITDETDTGRRRTDAADAPEPIDVETPERLRDELVGGLLALLGDAPIDASTEVTL